jgi:D-alanyl-D-alanine carboxypeptidase
VIGKTGYTRAAGRCFAGAASLDGREVIIVVLGSSNLWGDARKLIAYGLNVLAPEAAANLRFAAADPPRKTSSVRAKSGSKKKKATVAKSKRKPAKPTASAKRSSASSTKRAVKASVSSRQSGKTTRGCTGTGC